MRALRLMLLWLVAGVLTAFLFWPREFAPVRHFGGRIRADVYMIASVLEEHALAHGGRYPKSLDPLVEPDANGRTPLLMTQLPEDPWRRPYLYAPPRLGQPEPRIWTYGKDGEPGGEGDDADFGNWMLDVPELAYPDSR